MGAILARNAHAMIPTNAPIRAAYEPVVTPSAARIAVTPSADPDEIDPPHVYGTLVMVDPPARPQGRITDRGWECSIFKHRPPVWGDRRRPAMDRCQVDQ